MQIKIKHFAGQYPSFNVSLANEGKEPFLEIKGLRIMNGQNGEFVSWPSRKKDDGTYWNHVYASNDFNAAVLQAARRDVSALMARPPALRQEPPQRPPAPNQLQQKPGPFDDMDSDLPPF